MPVDLKDLKLKLRRDVDVYLGDEAILTVSWATDKLDGSYLRGSAVTDATIAALATDAAVERPDVVLDLVRTQIIPLLTGWDVTSGGKPWPLTAENVASLGLLAVRAINRALGADAEAALDHGDVGKGSKGGS